jgi:putative salt-induced outer membrane protein
MKKSTLFCLFAVVCFTFPVLAQETEEEAPPEPLWEGSAGLSYVATSGNTDTQSFGLDFTAKRRPTPWGYEFFALFNRAEDSSVLTAERYYAGGRVMRALGDRWELFGGISADKDQFAGFDMRAIVEVGATFKAVNTDKISLNFDVGLTWTDEDLVPPGEDWSYVGGIAGLHFAWAFSATASLTQDLVYYPNFDESSAWRLESVTALEASLTDLFGLRLSYNYRTNNSPPAGFEKSDTTTRASVVLKF